MKKSKQAKTSEGEDEGLDRISNLPDHILNLILSRLQGTEEVIRTSILSRRFRYLWTSVPSIDIDCSQGLHLLEEFDSNGFKEFVYWVLLNKPLDLDSFRLCCENYFNMLTIRQWIHAAVMRKVKLLDLMFRPKEDSEDIELPHSLVTCGSLEVLKLGLLGRCPCNMPCSFRRFFLPNITGFQALRVLELMEVELLDDNLVKYFLQNCPLLEDLSLIDCKAYDLVISSLKLKNLQIDTRQLVRDEEVATDEDGVTWMMCSSLGISCPKLVVLKLTGYVAFEFNFDSLYSLKEAVIHAQDLFSIDAPTYDLFARISHVEYLSISVYCVGQCFNPEVDAPISLPNLKTLELTVDGFHMDALIPFLTCLPDLESLHLIFPKHIYLAHKWKLDEAARMSIWTRHLKKVEFRVFDEEKSKLDVARALLEHGNELEEMVFSWTNEATYHERSMKTMKKVSKFHKVSSTVKIRCVINPSQADPRPAKCVLHF